MHFASASCFNDQACGGTQSLSYQVLVHGTDSQQCGDGHVCGIHLSVGNDEQVKAQTQCILGMCTQRCDGRFNSLCAPGGGIGNVEFVTAEIVAGKHIDMANLFHVVGC